jgi:hypothetical protein
MNPRPITPLIRRNLLLGPRQHFRNLRPRKRWLGLPPLFLFAAF